MRGVPARWPNLSNPPRMTVLLGTPPERRIGLRVSSVVALRVIRCLDPEMVETDPMARNLDGARHVTRTLEVEELRRSPRPSLHGVLPEPRRIGLPANLR